MKNGLLFSFKSEKNGCKKLLFLAFILILQVLVLLFWESRKSNLFPDEMHSFGHAKACGNAEGYIYIFDSEEWNSGDWVENHLLKERFEITTQDSILNLPISDIFRDVSSKGVYMGILNILIATFTPGMLSMRTAFIMNLFLFGILQCLMLSALYSLTKKIEPCIWGVMTFGFSGILIGLIVYVRFYIFCITLCSIAMFLNLKILKSDNLWKNIIFEILSGALALISYFDSELSIPLMAFFVFAFILILIMRKDYKKVGIYIGVLLLGVAVCWRKISWIFDVLFHPSLHENSENQVGRHIQRIKEISLDVLGKRIRNLYDILIEQYFGHVLVFILLMILLAVFLYKHFGKRGKVLVNIDNEDNAFVLVLCLTIFLFSIFLVISDLSAWSRYCSFLMWPLTLVLAYTFCKLYYLCKIKWIYNLALVALVGLEVVFTTFSGNIEYIFSGDKVLVRALENERDVDVVFLTPTWQDMEVETRAVYDCVHLLSSESRILPVLYEDSNIDTEGFSEEFLIWGPKGVDTGYLDEFMDAGYTIHGFGESFASDVYICQLNGDMPGTWLYDGDRRDDGNKYR